MFNCAAALPNCHIQDANHHPSPFESEYSKLEYPNTHLPFCSRKFTVQALHGKKLKLSTIY
jgi:hypothetical protein